MAREGYRWSEDRGRWESERDRDAQDREHDRDRYRDRDREAFTERHAGGRDDERGGRSEYRGRNDGPWDEGQAGPRSYGQGIYGNDLGRAANRYGNTGGDQYGGGGFRGGAGYGSRSDSPRSEPHGGELQRGAPFGHRDRSGRPYDDMPQRGRDSESAYEAGMPSYGGGIGSWFGTGGGFADVGVNGGFGNSMGYGGGSNTAPGSAMASGRGWGDRNNMSGYSGSMGTPSMPWSHGDRETHMSQSNHVGRGPKGWRRSDERIREDVSEQLERHPGIDASEIEVQVQQGEVTLSGSVADRHTKRMAEDVVEHVSGVREVQNQIRVHREMADSTKQAASDASRTTQTGSLVNAARNPSDTSPTAPTTSRNS